MAKTRPHGGFVLEKPAGDPPTQPPTLRCCASGATWKHRAGQEQTCPGCKPAAGRATAAAPSQGAIGACSHPVNNSNHQLLGGRSLPGGRHPRDQLAGGYYPMM